METTVLNAIMKRYKGLVNMFSALKEDEDIVLINLSDDVNNKFTEQEILEMILKIS